MAVRTVWRTREPTCVPCPSLRRPNYDPLLDVEGLNYHVLRQTGSCDPDAGIRVSRQEKQSPPVEGGQAGQRATGTVAGGAYCDAAAGGVRLSVRVSASRTIHTVTAASSTGMVASIAVDRWAGLGGRGECTGTR